MVRYTFDGTGDEKFGKIQRHGVMDAEIRVGREQRRFPKRFDLRAERPIKNIPRYYPPGRRTETLTVRDERN